MLQNYKKKTWGKFFDIGQDNVFFGYDSQNAVNMSKNRQIGLHQPISKGNNQQQEEKTYRMEENVYKPYI